MKKVFRKLHLWLSVPFGIFITLICFSGAMLVFEKEITEMCRHDLYFVKEVKEKPLPIDSLMKTVSATLPDTVSVTGVTISPDPERAWQVSLSKPRRSSVYVDQYTGEVKGRSERLAFYDVMFHMHRWMMGSAKGFGKLLVGVSTLMLVIILITGILMWLTNRKKPLTKSLKISFTKGWPRFWHDLHVAGGIYATIFLLALALTGLTWSFSWYRTGFYAMFGIESNGGGGFHGGGGNERGSRGGGERDGERGQRGERPEGRRGGRPDGERRDSIGAEAGKNRRNHDGAEADRRPEHRDGMDKAGRRGDAKAESSEAKADNKAAQEGREQAGQRRHDNEGQTMTEDGGERRYGEGGGEGRRRGGRGGRGGRYHHDGDSTGGYAGRHHEDGDSLHGRYEHAGRDIAEGGRHEARSEESTTDNAASPRKRDGQGYGERGSKRGERGGRPDGDRKGRGGKPEAAVANARNISNRDSLLLNDSIAIAEEQPETSMFAAWQSVYEKLANDNPGYRQITLSDGSASVVPEGRQSLRSGDKFDFDPQTGEITGSKPYSEQEKSGKVRGGVYMVHVGSWGGMLTRILTFLSALLGATLPLTGYYLWILKMRNKRRNKRNKTNNNNN